MPSFIHDFVKQADLNLVIIAKLLGVMARYFDISTTQKNWALLEGMNVNGHCNCYHWCFLDIPHYIALEVMKSASRKLILTFWEFYWFVYGLACLWIQGTHISTHKHSIRSLGASLAWDFGLCFFLHGFNPEHLENILCSGGSSLQVESCKY